MYFILWYDKVIVRYNYKHRSMNPERTTNTYKDSLCKMVVMEHSPQAHDSLPLTQYEGAQSPRLSTNSQDTSLAICGSACKWERIKIELGAWLFWTYATTCMLAFTPFSNKCSEVLVVLHLRHACSKNADLQLKYDECVTLATINVKGLYL